MPLVLLMLLLALPFLELYGLFRFAATFGLVNLLIWVVLTAVVGFTLIRLAMYRWVVRVGGSSRQGQRQALDQPLTIAKLASYGWLWLAGILLMLPGLIADGLGILLAIPPTRYVVTTVFRRVFLRGMVTNFQWHMETGSTFGSAREREPNDSFNNDHGTTVDAVRWSRDTQDNQASPKRLS